MVALPSLKWLKSVLLFAGQNQKTKQNKNLKQPPHKTTKTKPPNIYTYNVLIIGYTMEFVEKPFL